MGRPINKKWFGLTPVTPGKPPYGPDTPPGVIAVNGVRFADGSVFTNAYIVKQTGSAAYVVQDRGLTHAPEIVFMVNAASTAALAPGQCFINATPFGGSALPCSKISQFRLSVYNTPNTVANPVVTAATADQVSNYSWSTVPAAKAGEADLNGI